MNEINVKTKIYEERISYNVFFGDDTAFEGDKIIEENINVVKNITDENFAKGVASGVIYSGIYNFAYVVENLYKVSPDNIECVESEMIYEVYSEEEFDTYIDKIDPKKYS